MTREKKSTKPENEEEEGWECQNLRALCPPMFFCTTLPLRGIAELAEQGEVSGAPYFGRLISAGSGKQRAIGTKKHFQTVLFVRLEFGFEVGLCVTRPAHH